MDDLARTQPAPLPYAEVTDEAYAREAAATFTVREFDAAVVLSGGCPRCQDPITFTLVDAVFRRDAPPAPPLAPDGPTASTPDRATVGTPDRPGAGGTAEPAAVPAPRGATAPSGPTYRTIFCTCEVAHPYRAEGQVGCGAYWTLRLDVEP
ncbi:hypothetical protein GA0070609_1169 [Micromonospora echinaurantiaca]|uniref:Uncharacterized protein n=1 Tax=Micromonospora echinaurantiaca TaxID=47857 RepID=A0A1C5HAB4_9ACTN|nr:hypothetical protein [Micromonospora echinaurantiaca]SCG42411.1 hypothetical protein GA0070609_1169 [Micromonospora echinaurantiaca]